jgi:8-oxo-dGTP pyrophosphatase MutT (NUDIX family)
MIWTAAQVQERLKRAADTAPDGWSRAARPATERPAPSAEPAPPEAAVAIVLRFEPAPQVLLIRRAEQQGDPWSGHMAFPGGHHEPGDRDLVATAVRETAEEVGVDLRRSAELLGRLPPVPAVARGQRVNLVIVPFVFALTAPVELAAGPEVDEALWALVEPLTDGRADTVRPFVFEGHPLDLPAFRVGEHIVWGLTYRMLTMLFELMSD